MQIEPEVITEHCELRNSTNIERIVNGRDAVLVQIEQLIQQLETIPQLTAGIGGGNASDWAMKPRHRCDKLSRQMGRLFCYKPKGYEKIAEMRQSLLSLSSSFFKR